MSKEDFYPALWSYGCPRHDDCREPLIFSSDKMRCPQHGGIYRICEEELDEPIDLDDAVIYSRGEHALEHVEWDIDERTSDYTIMSCPECDPSEYYSALDGPVGDYCFSLYMRNDNDGRTRSALCRACGLIDHEEWLMDAPAGSDEIFHGQRDLIPTSQDGTKSDAGSKDVSALSTVIDNAIDKVVEWTSLAEDSFRFAAHRESAIPRWAQLLAGALCLPLSLFLGIGAVGFGTGIVLEGSRDFASLIALATIVALSVFFASVSYRLLSGQPRGAYGGLLSPTFMIGFGILMCGASLWMLFVEDSDLAFLLFGLAAVSAGLTLRRRAVSAELDKQFRNVGINNKDRRPPAAGRETTSNQSELK